MATVSRKKPRGRRLAIYGLVAVGLLVAFVGVGVNASTPTGGEEHIDPSAEVGIRASEHTSWCLGGPEQDNAMILAAQEHAGIDRRGAAQFAASFVRWLGSDPTPQTAEELARTTELLLAVDASDAVRTTFESAVAAARADESRDDWSVSAADGYYYIESLTDASATVSVAVDRVYDSGQVNAFAITFVLSASDHGWTIADITASRDVQDLVAIGDPYDEGC